MFILKCWLLVFVMMWVRWTLPRLRIDQVMMTCLKYLLPISCVLLVGVSLWQLLVPPVVADVRDVLAGVRRWRFVLVVFVSLFRSPPMPAPRGELPGTWDGRSDAVTANGDRSRRIGHADRDPPLA